MAPGTPVHSWLEKGEGALGRDGVLAGLEIEDLGDVDLGGYCGTGRDSLEVILGEVREVRCAC